MGSEEPTLRNAALEKKESEVLLRCLQAGRSHLSSGKRLLTFAMQCKPYSGVDCFYSAQMSPKASRRLSAWLVRVSDLFLDKGDDWAQQW